MTVRTESELHSKGADGPHEATPGQLSERRRKFHADVTKLGGNIRLPVTSWRIDPPETKKSLPGQIGEKNWRPDRTSLEHEPKSAWAATAARNWGVHFTRTSPGRD